MRTASLFFVLAATFASCGGASDPAALTDEGAKALGSGNYAEAAGQFDAALAGMDSSHDQYMRAMWGLIEAGAHVNPDRAKEDFLSFAKANSATTSANDYVKVGNWLSGAKNYTEAIYVVDAGVKAYPETPALNQMVDDLVKKAAAAGDDEATSALEGLGYIGD